MTAGAAIASARANPLAAHYLIGRAWNGFERDAGRIIHAVPEGSAYSHARALCGVRPGRRSAGWSAYPEPAVTCPRCQRLLKGAAVRGPATEAVP